MNADQLLKNFRAACLAAGVDPAAGSSVYQAANAKAELQKRRCPDSVLRWWEVDWSDPGECHSDVERDTFYRLFVASWRIHMRIESSRETQRHHAIKPPRVQSRRQGEVRVFVRARVPMAVAMAVETQNAALSPSRRPSRVPAL